MGFIKRGFLVVIGGLFLVAMLVANSFWTVSSSLEFEVVEPELSGVVKELAMEQGGVEDTLEIHAPLMESSCQNGSEYILNNEITGEDLVISCEVINEGAEAIFDEAVEQTIEQVYYEDYSCEGFDCITEGKNPFVLFSEKFRSYCSSKFFLALLVAFVLFVLMFFLVENKSNALVVAGSLIILSSLPLMKIANLLAIFTDKFLVEVFAIFFTQSYSVFVKVVILGVIVLGVGIAMKFFGWGFKIADFAEKFGKKSQKKVEE